METQNATSRGRGAIGPRALVPRLVEERYSSERMTMVVLDFGAGKDALHAQYLNFRGFYVHAWEYGDNRNDRHVTHIEPGFYDLAYASNVLNVQTTWAEVVQVVLELHQAIHHKGEVILNLPQSPRKAAWSHSRASKGIEGRRERGDDLDALYALLRGFFGKVSRIGGTNPAPVLLLSDKIQPRR